MNGPIAWYHGRFIHQRRVNVLARHLSEMIAKDASVLDVGCGDGLLASKLQHLRPDLSIRGIDVLVRSDTLIDVSPFDGKTIPVSSGGVDVVLFVDVLHHTESPGDLLAEASRVAGGQVVLKDHYLLGIAAQQTLALMDNVGNSRHGVEIPCNYQTPSQWENHYANAGLCESEVREQLGLYPPPFSWLFERSLHFIVCLDHRA